MVTQIRSLQLSLSDILCRLDSGKILVEGLAKNYGYLDVLSELLDGSRET